MQNEAFLPVYIAVELTRTYMVLAVTEASFKGSYESSKKKSTYTEVQERNV